MILIIFPNQKYIVEKFFYPHTTSTCNKLYRKDLIHKNNIRFEDVSYVGSEDTLFNYSILCNAGKIVAISDVLYNVFARNDSTVRTYNPGYMTRTSNLIKCLHKCSREYNNLDLYKESYPIIFIYFQQWNIDRIVTLNHEDNMATIESEIKEAMKSSYFLKSNLKIACVCDYRLTKNMKAMGYNWKGILFIRAFMFLSSIRLYKMASRLRTLKLAKG
jgi:hypothetical protein